MTDSCARLVSLKEAAQAANAELNRKMADEVEPLRQEVANITRDIANMPTVNMDINAYPKFYTLKDGITGGSRANQFNTYCSTTSYGGYPAGAFGWTGTQEPDGTGRILNICLDGGAGGSCQTKGWCAITGTYLNGLSKTADNKKTSLTDSLRAKSEQIASIVNRYAKMKVEDPSMPACCQVLSAAGANLNVPVVNQTCQVSSLVGSTGATTSDSGAVAAQVYAPATGTADASKTKMFIIIIIVLVLAILGVTLVVLMSGDDAPIVGSSDMMSDEAFRDRVRIF